MLSKLVCLNQNAREETGALKGNANEDCSQYSNFGFSHWIRTRQNCAGVREVPQFSEHLGVSLTVPKYNLFQSQHATAAPWYRLPAKQQVALTQYLKHYNYYSLQLYNCYRSIAIYCVIKNIICSVFCEKPPSAVIVNLQSFHFRKCFDLLKGVVQI